MTDDIVARWDAWNKPGAVVWVDADTIAAMRRDGAEAAAEIARLRAEVEALRGTINRAFQARGREPQVE